MPLACDTIHQLADLVLASCSLDCTASAPRWFCQTIDELLLSDPSFRDWASRSHFSPSERCAAGNLSQHLARDSSWMSRPIEIACTPHDGSKLSIHECDSEDGLIRKGPTRQLQRADNAARTGEARLWQTVQVAIRLESLHIRFSTALESAKREAIYQLAYGLSHEINNPLANIAARARVLAEDESDPQRKFMLAAIVDQAMRGCEMIADLMLVARPPKLDMLELDLGELLRETIEKCRPWATQRSVNLSMECIATDCCVEGDAIALREAIWCLLRNSLEAVTRDGRIEVSIECLDRDALLILEFRDSGPGLSAEALEHCFDPYFSGREAGRGLGLGLAKAERIISLHRGRICIANGSAGGCVARIELPKSQSKPTGRQHA